MATMETLVSLCKRRGIIFQSSEPYGGIGGFWDYGPVGVELKRRIKDFWWRHVVELRDDVVGIDSSIITHPKVWVASGHVDNFSDPMSDCKECKRRFRADDIPDPNSRKCPECGGELTEPRQFNLMFETYVGALRDETAKAYLRPETCQSIFVQFKTIQTVSRLKLPFGIAQIGKSFRNEITPRNFIFRSREFEQMEMEYFVRGEESQKYYEEWRQARLDWFVELGVRRENLRLRDHAKDELAHYAKGCTDVEYEFPFGWSELEGIADRGDYDLSQHAKVSGKDFSYFDDERNEKFVPHVVETSLGVDRTLLTVLADAYCEEEAPTAEAGETEKRVVLRLNPAIAPYQVAVFPLSKKLGEATHNLEHALRKHFVSDYDEVGSIGKRYRRHDEIGTPFCITYDFDSQTDQKATVRHRDSMKQDRVALDQIIPYLKEQLHGG